jgi:hypothetical protein
MNFIIHETLSSISLIVRGSKGTFIYVHEKNKKNYMCMWKNNTNTHMKKNTK